MIVDVDGTLVDVTSIRHHVTTKPKNFHKFHAESIDCPPHDWVVEKVAELAAEHTVFVVTARKERWWWHTTLWLRDNNVPYQRLFMRRDDDNRRDYLVKRAILQRIRRTHDVALAIDDNPAVIELWGSEGIPTIVVPGWDG